MAWDAYQNLLKLDVAKEVARMALPVNIFTKFYVTGNLRNWLSFLSLRAESHALYEIRAVAEQIEGILSELYPVTVAAWNDYDRKGM